MHGDAPKAVVVNPAIGYRVVVGFHLDANVPRAEHLKAILTVMRTMFDYVIVDTARTLKDEVLAVLDNADRIVLLGTPDIPSIKNARTFFEVSEALAYPPGQNPVRSQQDGSPEPDLGQRHRISHQALRRRAIADGRGDRCFFDQ